jgi:hypothetical protein
MMEMLTFLLLTTLSSLLSPIVLHDGDAIG